MSRPVTILKVFDLNNAELKFTELEALAIYGRLTY
jgi:hypothetical protein